jgi:hypothetical protein
MIAERMAYGAHPPTHSLFPVQHAVPLGQLLFVSSKHVATKPPAYTQCPVPSEP